MGGTPQIPPLTGLRGVSAVWVMLVHFSEVLEQLMPGIVIFRPIYSLGHLGVDVFFVLSGFIMSHVYEPGRFVLNRSNYVHFLLNRFARLYPNHLATLFILAGLFAGGRFFGIVMSGNYSLAVFPYHLAMLQAFPGVEKGHWNYPNWSISAEWFAYVAIFPTTFVLSKKIPRFFTAVLFSVALMLLYFVMASSWPDFSGKWLLQVSLEFMAGGLMHRAVILRGGFPTACARLAPVVLVLWLVACFVVNQQRLVELLAIRLFTLLAIPFLLAALYSERGLPARFLGCKPLVWLGLVSYALYMVHALWEKAAKILFSMLNIFSQSGWIQHVAAVLYLTVPVLLAWILYRFVEVPGRGLIKGWGNRFFAVSPLSNTR